MNSSPSNLLNALNNHQRQAASHVNGALLIVAGAGAGKTRTLTYRIANLIENGIEPHNILAITFTNKAAAELRERLRALLENKVTSLPTAATFHSLGVNILRQYGEAIGIPKNFTILDRGDQEKLIKEILKEFGFAGEDWTPRKIATYIGNRRQGRAAPLSQLENLLDRYQTLKSERSLLDFDDLIYRTVDLLNQSGEVRSALQTRWSHLHVDEYQDTNRIQYEMVKLLVGDNNNICAVGDTDQTIYTWRGAEIKNLLQFEKDFKDTTTVLLEENYRSSKTIIAVANDCIRKNNERIEKTLYTNNPDGELISVILGTDEIDEAKQIARETAQLIDRGVKPGEIAVLYRANFQSQAIEKAFISSGIKYDLLGTKFYQRREVKDMLAYLRYGLNPDNPLDLERIASAPKRGIGPKTLSAIVANDIASLGAGSQSKAHEFMSFLGSVSQLLKTKPPHEVMQYILDNSGWKESLEGDKESGEERLENLAELINVASEYSSFEPPLGAERLLEEAALMSEQDTLDENEAGVKLMTIHASKGLEFKYVFVTGLEEGLFPSDRSDSAREQEEERRLFYVALTRAKEKAHLSYATMRRRFGTFVFNSPSEFITEIDPQYLDQSGAGNFSKSSISKKGLLDDIEF